MSPNLQDNLKNKYPEQFRNLNYIECNDGWYQILLEACSLIQSRLDRLKSENKESDFYWAQIKEKFGGLRAYCYNADLYMMGIINFAERLSYNTCEFSGDRGKLRKKIKNSDGEIVSTYIKTLSDKEADKHGYV